MRWTEASGISVFRQPSEFSNGNTRDRQGRLVTCHHGLRALTRTEHSGELTVLARDYQGKRLNSPNDVIVKSDGTIWFSDPHYGINTDYEGGKAKSEITANLYRFDPRDNSLNIMADDFDGPNGLCFSPDEKKLYVVETGKHFAAEPVQYIRVFEVSESAAKDTSLQGGKIFYKVQPGNADGIRCDEYGNVWSSAGDGVHCISPDGRLLGKIFVPETVANITFGGRNFSLFFICASQSVYAIYTNVRGAQRP